jgi:Tol biopolymer transport system component
MFSSARLRAVALFMVATSSCRDGTGPEIVPAPPILFEINGSAQPNAVNAIYAINPDGTGQHRLTDGAHFDASSTWSADGHRIAFSSDRDGHMELYTMRADGSRPERLTHTAVDPGVAAPRLFVGSWSTKNVIAYVHIPPFESEGMLMTIPAGGGTATALTTGNQTLIGNDWSPDGNRIVFTSTQVGGTSHLFVIGANGTGLTQITSGAAGDGGPSWSPDGQRIAFLRSTVGSTHIWVVNADGTNPIQLTTGDWYDISPSWSPDGTEIAFASSRDGEGDIYIMKADGTNVRRVTTTAMRKTGVHWRRAP